MGYFDQHGYEYGGDGGDGCVLNHYQMVDTRDNNYHYCGFVVVVAAVVCPAVCVAACNAFA